MRPTKFVLYFDVSSIQLHVHVSSVKSVFSRVSNYFDWCGYLHPHSLASAVMYLESISLFPGYTCIHEVNYGDRTGSVLANLEKKPAIIVLHSVCCLCAG